MHKFIKYSNIFILTGLIGLLFKVTSIPLGRFLFVVGFSCSSIVMLIQLIAILFNKNYNRYCKMILTAVHFILIIMFISIICIYQWWKINAIVPFLATWFYIILTMVIIVERKRIRNQNVVMLYKLIPAWVVAFILGCISLLLNQEQFYKIFHSKPMSAITNIGSISNASYSDSF